MGKCGRLQAKLRGMRQKAESSSATMGTQWDGSLPYTGSTSVGVQKVAQKTQGTMWTQAQVATKTMVTWTDDECCCEEDESCMYCRDCGWAEGT